MIGLIFVSVLFTYVWICTKLTKFASGVARRRGLAGWKFGLPVGILTFGLLFWDWPLTFGMHRYYCLTEGGVRIHQTLEQWKEENPGVAETLSPLEFIETERLENGFRIDLNQRFSLEFSNKERLFGIVKRDQRINDTKTDKVMAELVDFSSALHNPFVGGVEGIRDYKAWLSVGTKRCEWVTYKKNIKINEFMQKVKFLGSKQ